ncbi:MAG: PorP/SprF family type IX secretion system membrane protein [Solitalea-like symbiont of Tyrophagus putrescentiae]
MSLNGKVCNIIKILFYNASIVILLIVLLGNNSSLKAQQLPIYSLNMQNPYILNPALAGMEDFMDLKVAARRQWMGVAGGPETFYMSLNTLVSKDSIIEMFRHGVGGFLWVDKAGAAMQMNASGSYAYHKNLTEKDILALGASVGLSYYRLNTEILHSLQPDEVLQHLGSSLAMDIALGGIIYSKSYYIGLSLKQLLPSSLYKMTGEMHDKNGDVVLMKGKRTMHAYLSLGYRQDLDFFEAAPSLLIRATPTQPLSIDYNLKLLFEEKFWVGASYRSNNSLIAMAGIYFNSFLNFAYAYDFNFFDLNHFGSGAHEFVLGFQISKDRIECPKFVW